MARLDTSLESAGAEFLVLGHLCKGTPLAPYETSVEAQSRQ
jgi:hypothetical protein